MKIKGPAMTTTELTQQMAKRDARIMKMADEIIRLNILVKEKQEVIDLLDKHLERIRQAVG